eukprot:Gb_27675 [translate_table: standard]
MPKKGALTLDVRRDMEQASEGSRSLILLLLDIEGPPDPYKILTFDNVVESGDPSKRKPYLPPDKQYLITRNVPCLRRAVAVEEDYEAAGGEILLDDEENEGWLATHGAPRDNRSDEENVPSIDTSERQERRNIHSISSYFGVDDEEEIPDMAEYEESENVTDNDAAILKSLCLVCSPMRLYAQHIPSNTAFFLMKILPDRISNGT